MDDNIKFEKNIFDYKRLAANGKKIPILFMYLGIKITYIYCTFSQVHILMIVSRCAEQNKFGIILNTHYWIFQDYLWKKNIFQVMFMDHKPWAFCGEKSMCVTNKFSSKTVLKNCSTSVLKTFMIIIIEVTTTDTFNDLMIHNWYIVQIFFFHEPGFYAIKWHSMCSEKIKQDVGITITDFLVYWIMLLEKRPLWPFHITGAR